MKIGVGVKALICSKQDGSRDIVSDLPVLRMAMEYGNPVLGSDHDWLLYLSHQPLSEQGMMVDDQDASVVSDTQMEIEDDL